MKAAIYHVYNHSIDDIVLFPDKSDFIRMIRTMTYYRQKNPPDKLSVIIKAEKSFNNHTSLQPTLEINERLIDIISYCLMHDHIHFNLLQSNEGDTSNYMHKVCDSYSRYFNTKYRRKGPLWQGRFKKVLVESDEQLLHLTRYIHLNPVTARLVEKPEDWSASSYNEYITMVDTNAGICNFKEIIDIDPQEYRLFVESRIEDQRELAKIKELIAIEFDSPLREWNFSTPEVENASRGFGRSL